MSKYDTFLDLQPRLFGIAYRMLGSSREAEDVVQDAYLRLLATPNEPIRSLEAFATTVVTRLCLDHLKSARVQREVYPGLWLPEPALTAQLEELSDPVEQVARYESLSIAFLRLLESLTPEERATFLLREVFEYEYSEIAIMLEKSEAACRQLFSRAKKEISEKRPRFQPSPQEYQQVFSSFIQALSTGDVASLTSLLTTDVTVYADGGGKAPAALRPIEGVEHTLRFLAGLRRQAAADFQYELVAVNGRAGMLVRDGEGRAVTLAMLEVGAGLVQAIYFIRNPEKLSGFGRQVNFNLT